LFLLVNWLPTLLMGQGFGRGQATLASILFNLGGVGGCLLLATLVGAGSKRLVLSFAYGGMAAAIAALGLVGGSVAALLASAAAAGFFVVGGQFVVYGLAPTYYPTLLRGTGVGAMVAVGRIGAILGPILAGYLLSSGFRPEGLFLAILPPVAAAWLAAFLLMRRPEAED
jgi:AAHS family 3-hydroxyphenylpropionic acid transporter